MLSLTPTFAAFSNGLVGRSAVAQRSGAMTMGVESLVGASEEISGKVWDPLKLSQNMDEGNLNLVRAAELKHCRVAMLATVGWMWTATGTHFEGMLSTSAGISFASLAALDPLIRREMQDEFLRLQDMLHKTIVFITHDFDEAIRLADRIAVMKDGAIQQIATPEELVLNPATEYVAEFTRHVSRSKVITAASVAVPVTGDSFAGSVAHDDLIDDIAEKIEASEAPHQVIRDGDVIGQITRQSVVDVLVGRQ